MNSKIVIIVTITIVTFVVGCFAYMKMQSNTIENLSKNSGAQEVITSTLEQQSFICENVIKVKAVVHSKPNKNRDELILKYEAGLR